MTSQTPTISWRRVQNKHYEKASSKDYHQLQLNHSVTGLLEINVTFSNSACEKSNTVQYTGEPYERYTLQSMIITVSFIQFQLKVC